MSHREEASGKTQDTCWRDYVSQLAWERLGVPPEELEEVSGLPAVFPVVGVASLRSPPIIPEAPPHVIEKVVDTKTNVTLSVTMFIISEEDKEGSGTDGRSDSSSSNSKSDDITDDVSSEETKKQNTQPMASLLPTETETSRQPMNKLHSDHMIITDEENLTSEEMMSDQPMFAFSDGEGDHFNNATSSGRNLNHQLSLSDDLTSTEFNLEGGGDRRRDDDSSLPAEDTIKETNQSQTPRPGLTQTIRTDLDHQDSSRPSELIETTRTHPDHQS
ncbi:hypothetical protein L3Q82_003712 [Scortum barcoo]|uniref:Uncharacterized protein n=1 Tax=Scortum barcoo TaxID=214431 RepID=A0ACB8X9J1_9TELE|nr:hypothetical protein L3Q82_003712 [Scortum barcoo]